MDKLIPANGIVSTIVKLLAVCLLVGMLLSVFDITPEQLLTSFGQTVERIIRMVMSFGSWAVRYIFVGAVVVVPIWLLIVLLRVIRRKG